MAKRLPVEDADKRFASGWRIARGHAAAHPGLAVTTWQFAPLVTAPLSLLAHAISSPCGGFTVAHMVQHLLLIMVAPPPLAAGRSRCSRKTGRCGNRAGTVPSAT